MSYLGLTTCSSTFSASDVTAGEFDRDVTMSLGMGTRTSERAYTAGKMENNFIGYCLSPEIVALP